MLERFAYILIFEFLLLKANNFCDRRELAKEVVELLMTVVDGKKFLIDASDRLILYVEIARLFRTLGYQWKAAFFSEQVVQLYLQQKDCLSTKSLSNVLVELANPCGFNLVVDIIYLSIHSGNFGAFSMRVTLVPKSAKGLSFIKARLLSMEILAHVSETLPKTKFSESGNIEEIATSASRPDCLVKIDPYRGSYGLRLLKLELSNPTDVVFEISVFVQIESPRNKDTTFINRNVADFRYPKTRTDRDFSAKVLIPLGNFKLPILDRSFLLKDSQTSEVSTNIISSFSEKNMKAELNAYIKSLISRIKVRWQSGRNSSGELNIKDAIHAALQTSMMDILLLDPLTFGFKLATIDSSKDSNTDDNLPSSKGSIFAYEMTPMEVLVLNNTQEMITVNLSITCRDVAGENCIEGNKVTVFWSGKVLIHC
ncbi:hypothetical protein GIB67_029747 [Kingdonia uniflora]|uniref:Trs120/TRAPPC9 third Ig-like domain-containing protein n=1 Tax=Kingdonia uniflora TaxID=39325 RepID=A0A7J7LM14_9MAGN|nr:hypothetical protein GIB67_029747 [Kingdonia uniflora]